MHVVHGTPEGAPVFTPGTELAEEFKELQPKSESGEKVRGLGCHLRNLCGVVEERLGC